MPEIIVKLGENVVHNYFLYKEIVTVGRAPDNEIVIENLAVSRRHIVIRREGDKYLLEDNQSANGTYVNGVRVTRTEIVDKDVITVGKHKLHFYNQVEAPVAASDYAEKTMLVGDGANFRPTLHIIEGKQKGQFFEIEAAETRIGRASDNEIRLNDWFVSKHHAVVIKRGMIYILRDLASWRHTLVNGTIVDEHTLRPGDKIQFGPKITVEFASGDPSASMLGSGRVPVELCDREGFEPSDSGDEDVSRPEFAASDSLPVLGDDPAAYMPPDGEDEDDEDDEEDMPSTSIWPIEKILEAQAKVIDEAVAGSDSGGAGDALAERPGEDSASVDPAEQASAVWEQGDAPGASSGEAASEEDVANWPAGGKESCWGGEGGDSPEEDPYGFSTPGEAMQAAARERGEDWTLESSEDELEAAQEESEAPASIEAAADGDAAAVDAGDSDEDLAVPSPTAQVIWGSPSRPAAEPDAWAEPDASQNEDGPTGAETPDEAEPEEESAGEAPDGDDLSDEARLWLKALGNPSRIIRVQAQRKLLKLTGRHHDIE